MSKQSAEDRGREMFSTPMGKLPPMAFDFVNHLCRKAGKCGEVVLTALIVYAQCVEGLVCCNELYIARSEDQEWFTDHGFERLDDRHH